MYFPGNSYSAGFDVPCCDDEEDITAFNIIDCFLNSLPPGVIQPQDPRRLLISFRQLIRFRVFKVPGGSEGKFSSRTVLRLCEDCAKVMRPRLRPGHPPGDPKWKKREEKAKPPPTKYKNKKT